MLGEIRIWKLERCILATTCDSNLAGECNLYTEKNHDDDLFAIFILNHYELRPAKLSGAEINLYLLFWFSNYCNFYLLDHGMKITMCFVCCIVYRYKVGSDRKWHNFARRGRRGPTKPIFIQQHSIFIAVAQYSMLVFFTTGLKTNYLPKI